MLPIISEKKLYPKIIVDENSKEIIRKIELYNAAGCDTKVEKLKCKLAIQICSANEITVFDVEMPYKNRIGTCNPNVANLHNIIKSRRKPIYGELVQSKKYIGRIPENILTKMANCDNKESLHVFEIKNKSDPFLLYRVISGYDLFILLAEWK